MAIEVDVPQSPGWWMDRLAKKLADRRTRLERLDSYYRGDPPLPEGAENAREAYRAFQRKARTNYARLIVEARRKRMIPTGFTTGAPGDENGDAEARKLWMANGLDVESAEVHRTMLKLGDAYVIVGKDNDTGQPIITAEDPRQVVTMHDPVNQRRVVAALKMFRDSDAGLDYAYLYLPGRVYVASAQSAASDLGAPQWFNPSGWDWDEARSGTLPYPVVPVVRFRNENGMGVYEPHLDHLDRINHMLLQRMVIATAQAFRQRVLKGDLPKVYPPQHPQAGEPIDYSGIFSADPGALWLIPGAADVIELGQVDLTPILTSVRHDVQDLAAVTFTPLFYITPDAANGSAEGASTMKESLVFDTRDVITRAKDGWSQVMSLAFRFAGDDERADLSSLTSMFADPEQHSLAERYDAGVKAVTAGVSWRTRMRDVLAFSPEQVADMESQRAADLIYQSAGATPTPPNA